ncbi:MAG: diaminopimelate decarboxylase [Halobacteriovoraceae bacterium]|nr:diaminopimelate decarboxylase [Halobacteriovoraceae bacterium]|tara:strand:- start:10202 stop:11389 length:1188 start_codon:yes stop_codon:yes gene_type:complete
MQDKIQSIIDRFDAPFFFYNLDHLKAKLEDMKQGLDPDIKLWYACKANPMSAVIKVLRNLGFGLDVASSGELHQVLNTGVQGSKILATGPGKSKEYLEHLIKNGVQTIVLESPNQAVWLNEVAEKLDKKIDCLLRLQLSWSEGKSVLGGDEITPFGVDTETWDTVDFKSLAHLNIRGFHCFQWGNMLEVSKLEKIWEVTINTALEFAKKHSLKSEVLDLGGGLGIPYDFETPPIDFTEVKAVLHKLKEKYKLQEIWMELGRFVIGDSGRYYCKVVDIKKSRGKNLIVTDGGINHIARVALVNQAFPIKQFASDKEHDQAFQIHGPLCTALDKLGEFPLPADIKIGDWLEFHGAGAYGFTESMPYFLCHMLPGEVVYYNGDLMIPRPPKTSYDWMI